MRQVARLLPDLRLILTLRHPIERLWSQTLYVVGTRRVETSAKWARFLCSFNWSGLAAGWFPIITEPLQSGPRRSAVIRCTSDCLTSYVMILKVYMDGVLRHIRASTPWTMPPHLVGKKVWSTSSLVEHERTIPEIARFYIAHRLLEPTERLNQLLEKRVTEWVSEMRAIRGRTRLSWRILSELNRTMFSVPEKIAYEGYHAVFDARLRLRRHQLRNAYVPRAYRRRQQG